MTATENKNEVSIKSGPFFPFGSLVLILILWYLNLPSFTLNFFAPWKTIFYLERFASFVRSIFYCNIDMLFFEAVIFLLTYSNVYLFPSFFDVAVLWLFFFLHMSEISCLKYIFLIQHQFFFHLFQHLLKLLIYCAIFYYFPFVWEVLRLFISLSVLQLLMWSNSISFGITCQINLWAEKDRFFWLSNPTLLFTDIHNSIILIEDFRFLIFKVCIVCVNWIMMNIIIPFFEDKYPFFSTIFQKVISLNDKFFNSKANLQSNS